MKKQYLVLYVTLSLLFVILFFFFFVRNLAARIYCERQIARKVINFKNAAFKYGVVPVAEVDNDINSQLKSLFEKCLKNEGLN